jgi:outer membrane protein TolC
VREYRALRGVARSELFPQLSLNGTVSENQVAFGSFPVQTFNIVRFTGT